MTRGDKLKCGRCSHLLGVRYLDGTVVALLDAEDRIGGGVGPMWAIPCVQNFGHGKRCRGGWIDPIQVDAVRFLVEANPTLGPVLGGALADAERARSVAAALRLVGAAPEALRLTG